MNSNSLLRDKLALDLFRSFQDFQTNAPTPGGSQQANQYVADKLADAIADGIERGSRIVFRGTLTVEQINAIPSASLQDGDMYLCTTAGTLNGETPVEVQSNTAVIWNGKSWLKFIEIDLSNYYTKAEVDGAVNLLSGSISAHVGDTNNPHNVTAQQVGADPSGTAASLVAVHNESSSSHQDIRALVSAEAEARSNADSTLGDRIDAEATTRSNADIELQSQIDAITSKSDVVAVVPTYAALIAYDTSTLGDNDIIKVLADETHDDARSYYQWHIATGTWSFVGSEAPSYTKSETDTLLDAKMSTSGNNAANIDSKFGKKIIDAMSDGDSGDIRDSEYVGASNVGDNWGGRYSFGKIKAWVKSFLGIKTSGGSTTKFLNETGAFSTVSVPTASSSNPAMDGTASPGSSTSWSRGDHVHPTDTSRASNTPEFSEASTRSNLVGSGESMATILGKVKKFFSDLKTVAFTGSYDDLSNKPTIPSTSDLMQKNGSNATSVAGGNIIRAMSYWSSPMDAELIAAASTDGRQGKYTFLSLYNYIKAKLDLVFSANNLLSGLPVWTSAPTDTTYMIRQDLQGQNSFGRVTFLSVYEYFKSKIKTWLGIDSSDRIPDAHLSTNLVHRTGDETIGGTKTFSDMANGRMGQGIVYTGNYGMPFSYNSSIGANTGDTSLKYLKWSQVSGQSFSVGSDTYYAYMAEHGESVTITYGSDTVSYTAPTGSSYYLLYVITEPTYYSEGSWNPKVGVRVDGKFFRTSDLVFKMQIGTGSAYLVAVNIGNNQQVGSATSEATIWLPCKVSDGNYDGSYGASIGTNSRVTGRSGMNLADNSFVAGNRAKNFGSMSLTVGTNSITFGEYALALLGDSIAGGASSVAAHTGAMMFATGGLSGRNYQLVAGAYNAVDSASLFVVGGGSADSSRKNVFSVRSNGDVFAGPSGADKLMFSKDTVYEASLGWGNKNITGGQGPVDCGIIDDFAHNRLAFIDPSCIKVEYTDDGTTWQDYGASDQIKTEFTSIINNTNSKFCLGKNSSAWDARPAQGGTLTDENMSRHRLRVTISSRDSNGNSIMSCSVRKLYVDLITNGAQDMHCIVTKRTIGDYNNNVDNWTQVTESVVAGWPAWNTLYLGSFNFGGNATQTSQFAEIRMEFYANGVNTSYTSRFSLRNLRMCAPNIYSGGSVLGATGMLFSYDWQQNATFPAIVYTKRDGTARRLLDTSDLTYTTPAEVNEILGGLT